MVFKATRVVKQYNPQIKVIGFCSEQEKYSLNKFKESGADAFISKFERDHKLIHHELNRVMAL